MDTYEGEFIEFTILQQIEMSREKVVTERGKKNKQKLCEILVEVLYNNKIGEEVQKKLVGSGKSDLREFYERLKPVPFTLTPSLHYARRNPYLHN